MDRDHSHESSASRILVTVYSCGANVAHDMDLRLRIEGFSIFVEIGEYLTRVAGFEQRAGVFARRALDQSVDVAVDPDRLSLYPE